MTPFIRRLRRPSFSVSLISLVLAFCIGAARADSLDSLEFGNGVSEQQHAAVVDNTTTETGGLNEKCRRIQPGGALEFDAVCDPQNQTYVTVKFWGSDTEVSSVYLFNGDKAVGAYGDATPDLLSNDGGAALPGRFYYVTYPIPLEMTTGKQKVHVKLVALGALSPYAAKAEDKIHPLKGPSIGFYRAYTSTDPFFVPDAGEKQGTAPTLVPRPAAPAADAMTTMNHQQIDALVTRMLDWQLYGPAWDARVQAGAVPAILTGATVKGKLTGTEDEMKDSVTARYSAGNDAEMNIAAIYAKAYSSPWSKFYHKPEMLDRVVKALDFFCVAQGANGGFNSNKWVGGPKRTKAGHCLEGFGSQGPARAFLEVAADLQDKKLLDQPIDADGDPAAAPVPRKTAYLQMFTRHRDFLISDAGRGHASNQDMGQMRAMWLCNEAVGKLDPAQAMPRETALDYVYQAVGLKPNPQGGYWLTTKGLSLEPWGTLAGGYCGNYGLGGMHEACDLAALTGDDKVRQKARDAVESASHFYYPVVTADGNPTWVKEGIISTRNTKWPCVVDYGWDGFAGADLKESVVQREFTLWYQDGNMPEPMNPQDAHVFDSALGRLYGADWFDALLKDTVQTPLLPMEKESPSFAWADEQGQAVAIKDGDAHLYLSLNWRRGFEPGGRDAAHTRVNNIARAHYSDPAFDRIATFSMETVDGVNGLDLCRYGNYDVVMNTSDSKEYPVTLPPGVQLASVRDLVSGKTFPSDAIPALKAQSTYVLYLGK